MSVDSKSIKKVVIIFIVKNKSLTYFIFIVVKYNNIFVVK